ncbi:Hpt protein [Sulfitobacter noctilucae]|uniref:Hpt domain-containing protein n=1 Tax=Sulfitobacter noctilucae TaxID=1342302 RepID=UPI00046971C0|nr:Hpt domain-containing protein [Sulfitobacter noctilucae]KIN65727.1 Hpt protein [Sulfitobacter noctilucae]
MINWQRLRELQDEIGAEDFDEVVDLFLEEVAETIQRVSSAQDVKTLGEDLHFLKGSALTLGFEQFAAMCKEGEDAAQKNAAAVIIEPILACYALSKDAFLSEYKQQLAA